MESTGRGPPGSATTETTDSASLQKGFAHNWTVFNQVTYREYVQTCVGAGQPLETTFSARPDHFDDVMTSATKLGEAGDNYSHRRSTYAGEVYTKSGGTNFTFEAGVTLGFISVSAKASFSRNTLVEWHVKYSNFDLMCGTDGSWATAQNAAIKLRRGQCGSIAAAAPQPAVIKPDC